MKKEKKEKNDIIQLVGPHFPKCELLEQQDELKKYDDTNDTTKEKVAENKEKDNKDRMTEKVVIWDDMNFKNDKKYMHLHPQTQRLFTHGAHSQLVTYNGQVVNPMHMHTSTANIAEISDEDIVINKPITRMSLMDEVD